MKKRGCLFGLLMALLVGFSWADEVEKTEQKKFPLNPDGIVMLSCDDGYIHVQTWDKDEVLITMTKRAWGRTEKEAERVLEDLRVRIQDTRAKITIKELPSSEEEEHFSFFDLFDGDFWREKRWRRAVIDFELTVPVSAELKLESDEGEIELIGNGGNLEIESDEGKIEIRSPRSGRIQVYADEGFVLVENYEGEGALRVEADEGEVTVDGGNIGEINVSTDEGNILIRELHLKRCWLTSDEGDFEADFFPAPGGNFRFETDEGTIVVTLKDPQLQVRLETGEGRIDSDFDLERSSIGDGTLAEGVIGNKDGVLRAVTQEGDIVLRKR